MKTYDVFVWNEQDNDWHIQNANDPLSMKQAQLKADSLKAAGYKVKIKFRK